MRYWRRMLPHVEELENQHIKGLVAEMLEASIDCGDGMIVPRIHHADVRCLEGMRASRAARMIDGA